MCTRPMNLEQVLAIVLIGVWSLLPVDSYKCKGKHGTDFLAEELVALDSFLVSILISHIFIVVT